MAARPGLEMQGACRSCSWWVERDNVLTAAKECGSKHQTSGKRGPGPGPGPDEAPVSSQKGLEFIRTNETPWRGPVGSECPGVVLSPLRLALARLGIRPTGFPHYAAILSQSPSQEGRRVLAEFDGGENL
jgi:hypothetical protein